MSDTSLGTRLLVCDRKEDGVAVLISDGGEELKVLPPLSDSFCEGGVYRCSFDGKKLICATRDKEEEERRRKASAALLSSLFGKK